MPFDKSLLTRQLPVIVIRASNRSVSGLVKRLKPHVIRFKNIRPVIVDDSENCKRLIRLQPSKALDTVLEDSSMKELLAAADAEIKTDELTIGYDNMPTDEALRALLPESVSVVPSSFETAGHIAHMNLLAEHLPHRHLIGEVILDKNPPIRTVVYKTGNIETEFRTFPMEIIAGVDDTIVEQRQCGARFQFDYRTVYWNTRLQMEHERIIKGMPKGAIICDMFAGVGPFSVPLAKAGHKVYANDKNPESYRWLCNNKALNKIGPNLTLYNECGRNMVRRLIAEGVRFDQVLMNLPALGVEFLDSFVGIFHKDIWPYPLPTVHCYCFSQFADADECRGDVIQRVRSVLGVSEAALPDAACPVRPVRDVAPAKWMMCAEFQLPDALWVDSVPVSTTVADAMTPAAAVAAAAVTGAATEAATSSDARKRKR